MVEQESTHVEEWRPVVGYETEYEVSDYGRVRRTLQTRGTQCGILKQWQQKSGHKNVRLSSGNVSRLARVHRLVLEAFVGPCPALQMCRHDDGDPRNNRKSNLSWGTSQQNQLDRRKHGTDSRGERCVHAKLTNEKVREMRQLRAETGMTYQDIADRYGVCRRVAARAISGESWGNVS